MTPQRRYALSLGFASLRSDGAEHALQHVLHRAVVLSRLVLQGGPVEVLRLSADGRTLRLSETEPQTGGRREFLVSEPALPAGTVLTLRVRDASSIRDRGWVLRRRWPFVAREPCGLTAACTTFAVSAVS
jgi:hypothetical protein